MQHSYSRDCRSNLAQLLLYGQHENLSFHLTGPLYGTLWSSHTAQVTLADLRHDPSHTETSTRHFSPAVPAGAPTLVTDPAGLSSPPPRRCSVGHRGRHRCGGRSGRRRRHGRRNTCSRGRLWHRWRRW